MDLMTTQELADFLKVERRYIYHLVNEEGLPTIQIGKRLRFNRADVEKWLKEHQGGNNE